MPARRELVLIGGGGHALVVAEAALLAGWSLGGFLDDAAAAPLGAGSPAAWRLAELRRFDAIQGRAWILAVGGLGLRRELLRQLAGTPGRSADPGGATTVAHPAAAIAPSADIGAGVFVGPGAVVHTRARIGPHAIVNSAAVIEHEVVVGENAHIAPGAVLGGRCLVGMDALVGLGARVLPGVRIGDGALVGAGAVVIADVAPGACVAGVPARPLESRGS